jgi:hypothetical protein
VSACSCELDTRTEARFDTRHEPERDPEIAELIAETRRQRIREGWRVCRACGQLPHPNDMEWLFHKELCSSCAFDLVDKLLYKIAKRHGRKRCIKLLARLAK